MGTINKVSRLKVVAGFTLLLAVLFYSLDFVQKEVDTLLHTEGQDTQWMDSLSVLLKQKDENTVRILRTLTEVNDSLISKSQIESIITSQDTMLVRPRVQRRVVRHEDTLVTQHEKKGFFRRLRDAFVPPKQDSAIQVKTRVEYVEDTLLEAYNPVDTLQARLRAVVERERRADTVIRRRRRRLQAVNSRLSARIDTLLKHYEEGLLLRARAEAEHRQEVRSRSAQTIGGIATGAVVLAALFLLLIGRDIGRNNRYRRELEEARRRAEDLLAVREKMMLAITHDFKAPLGSIMGYADLLSRLTTDERQRFYLNNMKTSSEHLLKLVTDLLDFHRLDLHKAEINRVPFHPARLLEEIRVSFEPLTAAKGLELRCDISPELHATYISDPLRLRQIVSNLLSNAVKFTEHGSITLRASWREHRLILAVADTGCGMDPADRDRIFQEFTRLPGAQGQEGFGLGLSIVRMLVNLLGGSIKVESRLGQGSTFTVDLPLDKALVNEEVSVEKEEPARLSVPAAQARHDHPSHAFPPSSPKRLLLIDDDRIQLTLTVAMLRQGGIEALACQQVDELLEALRTQDFDVLLTDVQMPALNGFELLRLLRASNISLARTIPVVAVTARSDMQRADFESHGFAGCLHKPFTVQELLGELQRIGGDNASVPPSPPPSSTPSAGIDLSALTAFSADDPEAASSILRSFVEETRGNADRLRRAIEAADVAGSSAVAHKMIPLFTLIKATRIVPLLRRLEAARTGTLTPELHAVADEVLAGVEQVLKEAEQTVEPIK